MSIFFQPKKMDENEGLPEGFVEGVASPVELVAEGKRSPESEKERYPKAEDSRLS